MIKKQIIDEAGHWAVGFLIALTFLALVIVLISLASTPHIHSADCYNYGHLSCDYISIQN